MIGPNRGSGDKLFLAFDQNPKLQNVVLTVVSADQQHTTACRAVTVATGEIAASPRTRRQRQVVGKSLATSRAAGAAGRGPSAWRAGTGRPRSSGVPSDNQREGPTSRGKPRASCCIACAGG